MNRNITGGIQSHTKSQGSGHATGSKHARGSKRKAQPPVEAQCISRRFSSELRIDSCFDGEMLRSEYLQRLGLALGLLIISQCLLPVLGRSDFFPLFDWNLFTDFPQKSQYAEILIHKAGPEGSDPELLTHSAGAHRPYKTDRIWNLAQAIYRHSLLQQQLQTLPQSSEEIKALLMNLAPERNGYKMIEIAPIEDILAQYVQSSPSQALQKLGSRTALYQAQ